MFFINLSLIFLLGGCISNYETRGYVPEEEKLVRIQAGKSSREDVINVFGYPMTVPAFGDKKWLYVETQFEGKAFISPRELQTKVLEIEFDSKDKVSRINAYELDDTQKMKFSTDTTPTYGHSINAVQQMIGNIGRFNKQQ